MAGSALAVIPPTVRVAKKALERVWFARRGEHAESRADSHSDKPECPFSWFERHWPNTPKIELNRRGRPRPGWSAWGAEAEAAE